MKEKPVYQQYEDEYRLLLVELLLFLSMSDNQAKDYLNCLKSDGTIMANDVVLQFFTGKSYVPYKPLEMIAFSANEYNIRIFSLSVSDFLNGDELFAKNSCQLRLKFGRLRSVLGLLFWLSRRNPAYSCECFEKFIDSDIRWLILYHRLKLGMLHGSREYAYRSLGLVIADSEIDWDVFGRDCFFESEVWRKARSLALEITAILKLIGIMPDLDMLSLAQQFED